MDVHATVTLRIHLVFIDSAKGIQIADVTIPSQRLVVSHGQPGVEATFRKLFSKAKPAVIASIVSGLAIAP